jgi:hypothetical protein
MVRSILCTSVLVVFSSTWLRADFSMEQTSQITGGMLAGMMKMAGAFTRQAREPMHTTVAVKGDRMVHLSAQRAQIIDLGKETITSVDFQRKTYSVMTFAQMKQALADLSARMRGNKQDGADVKFKVSVNPTGQTKQIAGVDTRETILKIEMEGSDPNTGQTGTMTMTSDMWLVPKVAGYEEVTNFHRRMAQKLDWAPGGGMMMAHPDIAKAMSELYKQSGSLDGIPVYQIVKMGAAGAGAAPPAGTQAPPPQQAGAQDNPPSAESALGAALGGKLGRFGGLGRKKKQDAPPADQASSAPASEPATAPQGDASGALMEMTMEASGFSSAAVDSARFDVPDGFKQVEPEMLKHSR